MTEMLSSIENWRRNNAAITLEYEVSAVVEATMEGWDYGGVKAIAEDGVSDADRAAIMQTIAENKLDCTLEDCVSALQEYCRRAVVNAESDLIV